jgi:hypothetical protein
MRIACGNIWSVSLDFGLFSGVFPYIFSVNKRKPAISNLTGFNQFGSCFGAHHFAPVVPTIFVSEVGLLVPPLTW